MRGKKVKEMGKKRLAAGNSTGRSVGPTRRPGALLLPLKPCRTSTIAMIVACWSILFATLQFIHFELASPVWSQMLTGEKPPASPISSLSHFSADAPRLFHDNPQLRRVLFEGVAEKLEPERKEGKESQKSDNPSKHSAPPSQNAALPSINSAQSSQHSAHPFQISAPPSPHSAHHSQNSVGRPSLRENTVVCGTTVSNFCIELPDQANFQTYCDGPRGKCCKKACNICPSLYDKTGHALFPTYSYLARCDFQNDLGVGSFTIELWVQMPAEGFDPGTGIPFFSYSTSGASDTVQDAILVWNKVQGQDNFRLTLKVKSGQGVSTVTSAPWNLLDGKWHHIAVTRTADSQCALFGGPQCCTASFYKDGDLYSDLTSPNFKCENIATGGCVVLGQEEDGECTGFQKTTEFVGKMTEVRLWRYARSLNEIQEHMRERIGIDEANNMPGLVALWPLDCVYQLQELVAQQHFTTCSVTHGPIEVPAHSGTTPLVLATIEMNDGEICPGMCKSPEPAPMIL